MHGARSAVLQGGAADGGGPMRAGVSAHQAAVWDRAGSQRQAARCARTTTAAAGTSAADPGETACVSAGPAGGGVTEKPARCSHRLRAAQLGRPDALRRRRTAQDRQQRGGAGAPADRVGPEELALRRERSRRASYRHPVFAGADLQAPADQSVRVSARCDRARLDASGAAGPGADATRVEAPAAGVRHASRRLNGAFLTIRPRLLPVSSIPIYLSSVPPTMFFAIGRWTVEMYLVPRLPSWRVLR